MSTLSEYGKPQISAIELEAPDKSGALRKILTALGDEGAITSQDLLVILESLLEESIKRGQPLKKDIMCGRRRKGYAGKKIN